MHVPFMHVPLHGMLQPPQWALLARTSTHWLPHSIDPAAAHTQVLLLQVAPVGQGEQPPQWAGVPSPPAGMQAPSEHMVCVQVAEQLPPLQLCPCGQAAHVGPQVCAVEPTHWPLHSMRPEAQAHWPAVHTCPTPHARPHEPQLLVSVATFRHSMPQAI
jgi:hypothetical protein